MTEYVLSQLIKRNGHNQKMVVPVLVIEAIRLAQPFLEDGSLDPAKMEVLRQFRSQLDAPAGTTTPQQKSRPD